jgi:hypothetical protein
MQLSCSGNTTLCSDATLVPTWQALPNDAPGPGLPAWLMVLWVNMRLPFLERTGVVAWHLGAIPRQWPADQPTTTRGTHINGSPASRVLVLARCGDGPGRRAWRACGCAGVPQPSQH